MSRLIFLDIDGVLNGHERHSNGYSGTRPECVAAFNRIIREADAKIVVTSSWRYMAGHEWNTSMCLQNLLLTHGVDCLERVVGWTRKDVSKERTDRGPQIIEWLDGLGFGEVDHIESYVVIDDIDLEITECGHPFVLTLKDTGLTESDASKAIGILMERPVTK